ncbi:MAG: hypothetical protein WC869_00860 [Phycisphaerae bacterium]|jgi:hypothetical protein
MTKCYQFDTSVVRRDIAAPATLLAVMRTVKAESPITPTTDPQLTSVTKQVNADVGVDVSKLELTLGQAFDLRNNIVLVYMGDKGPAVQTIQKVPGMKRFAAGGKTLLMSTFYDRSKDELFIFTYQRMFGLTLCQVNLTVSNGTVWKNEEQAWHLSRGEADVAMKRFVAWHWLAADDPSYSLRIVEEPKATGNIIDPKAANVVYRKGQVATIPLQIARAEQKQLIQVDPTAFVVIGPATLSSAGLTISEAGRVVVIPTTNDRILTAWSAVPADNLRWEFDVV